MSIRGLITLGLIEGVDEVITLGLDAAIVTASTKSAKRAIVSQDRHRVTVSRRMGVTVEKPGPNKITIEVT